MNEPTPGQLAERLSINYRLYAAGMSMRMPDPDFKGAIIAALRRAEKMETVVEVYMGDLNSVLRQFSGAIDDLPTLDNAATPQKE